MLLRDFRLSCPRCYRGPRGVPPFKWCTLCISKLAIVAEYDQMQASETPSLSVFERRRMEALAAGTWWAQEVMP